MTKEDTMTSGTHDKVEGKVHEVKGTVKEHVGHLTNDPDLQAEGTAEKINGKVETVVGKIKSAFEK